MAGPPSPATLYAPLLTWYDVHRRALPWRARPGVAAQPYHVLVSEVMLQQTTAATVDARFGPFLARFPNLASLARAGLDEVLHAWQGLGYYRRARALHGCARAVMSDHDGAIPHDPAALRALPGLGPYTAAAIRAIAFDQPALPVDANVTRVLARVMGICRPRGEARRQLEGEAEALAPRERPGDVAQGLMDLGATLCRPNTPKCLACPWHGSCLARRSGQPEAFPAIPARSDRPTRRGLAFLLRRDDGRILFRRRPASGLLGGLHELPSSPWQPGPLDLEAALEHAPAACSWDIQAGTVRHVFTHFALELTLARGHTEAPPDGLWTAPTGLDQLALPTVMAKVLRFAGVIPAQGKSARL